MRKHTTVRGLLKARSRWTQGVYAQNRAGNSVNPGSVDAVSFCLRGAVDRLYPKQVDSDEAATKIKAAIRELFPQRSPTLIGFNDSRVTTHADVLKVVNAAQV